MKLRKNYLINENTVLFYGEYQQYGELFTVVIDSKDRFLVPMSPLELINKSLLSYGGDFKGALKSSKKLLGDNKKMYPIKIDASLDIWIFPTKAYVKHNCVWFSLRHIISSDSLGMKCTKVFLNYGHTMKIKMREKSFLSKRSLAFQLRDMIHLNTQQAVNNEAAKEKGFLISEENETYTCNENKENEET